MSKTPKAPPDEAEGAEWKRRRIDAGKTEREIADAVGLKGGRLAVVRIESGRERPSVAVSEAWAEFFGVSVEYVAELVANGGRVLGPVQRGAGALVDLLAARPAAELAIALRRSFRTLADPLRSDLLH